MKHELGWADYPSRSERAIVRHWQLGLLAFTFSLLVGVVPTASPHTSPSPEQESTGGGKISIFSALADPGPRRVCGTAGAGRLGGDAASGAQLALPVGTAAALVDPLVEHRSAARVGRAPRSRRTLPPTGGTGDGACRPYLTNQR